VVVEKLKHDSFGSIARVIENGRSWIRRDTRDAAPVLRWIARRVAAREARALRRLEGLAGVPRLLAWDGRVLERSHIAGCAMQEARPRDPAYFRAARRLVLALHRRGVAHNDLAKEPNWLVTEHGAPAVVDFQIAWIAPRRRGFFRLLAREDLRHLLKHKRTYCPERLTPIERRVLARRSWVARLWSATGKRVYVLLTRRLLRWRDNEGRG
jgi:RIO-like serine/threonine protein kinase